LELKKKITITVNVTTLLAILATVIGLGLLGVSLSYHPKPQPEALMWLVAMLSATVMPVIIIWGLKLQLIQWRWLRRVLMFLLSAYGCFLTIYMGWGALTDSGGFILWFPLCVYGVLIVLAVCLFIKRDAS